MTEPAQSGGPSPLRVGGLALVGAGAVAALIGLATLLPGGGGGSTTPTSTPAVAESATPAPTAAPTSVVAAPNGTVPVPSFAPTPTNAVAAPNGTAPAPAGTGGSAQAGGSGIGSGAGAAGSVAVHDPVRVYNNSTITGLAAHAANDFRADGWQVEKVSNYPSGIIATSTVYYRPGTSEQSAASSLGGQFGLRVEPRFSGIDDATPGLIVIVTNDYQKR
ncbi:MAG: LytR C-terminal domain-containing protein [Pseudonocardiales bacterium]|nr:LytR C-terminal domain-containing protein [Pseudonocardiales bacterium]